MAFIETSMVTKSFTARESRVATADSGSYRLSDAELLALSSRRRSELHRTVFSVLSLLREASKSGTTVLIASHDARAASIATRRLELVDGVVR